MKLRHHHYLLIATGFLSILIAVVWVVILPSRAATLTSVSDALNRLKIGTAANHEILFVTPSGVAAGENVRVDFTGYPGNTFNISAITPSDVDLAVSNGTCSGVFSDEPLAGAPSGATWGVGIAGQDLTITSGTGTVPAGRCVRIRIGTNATGGANQIINPPTTTGIPEIRIDLFVGASDRGMVAIGITTEDKVAVGATVAQMLIFDVVPPGCSFGTMSANLINACGYDTVVTTNAANGYTVTMMDPTEPTTMQQVGGGAIIPAVTGPLAPGTSQYGITTADNTGAVVIAYQAAGNCSPGSPGLNTTASATTGAPQIIADATTAVLNDTVPICHKVTISSSQAAGSYINNLTYSATGNF
ncbi:MAG: hypothetical protein V1821_02820 [bacterium]